MEDKQQQQQQQQDVAVQPRRSSRLAESPLTKKTRINTSKNKSPFVNRRLLPTQRNRSSSPAIALKRSASVVSFADSISVSIMPPKKKTKTTTAAAANSKRGNNFAEMEDQFICQAYINVSTDPTIGNGRRSKDFWSNVHRMYGEFVNQNKHLMEDPLVRDVASIKNRWSKQIQKHCLIFMTFYNRAHKNRVSGTTDDDVLDAAIMEEHREQLGTPFKFKHCLAELEKIPKFNPKSGVVEEEEVVEILDDDDDDDDVVEVDSNPSNQKKMSATKVKKEINNTLSAMGANLARPIGSKQAKANLKDDKSSGNSMDKVANMTERIAAAMEVTADGEVMEQIRKDIQLYTQLGMTEQVGPLLATLASLREQMMEARKQQQAVPSTTATAATEPNPSPLTLSSGTGDDNAITLLETPAGDHQPNNPTQLNTPLVLDSQLATEETEDVLETPAEALEDSDDKNE
jgi:hypothetical protein